MSNIVDLHALSLVSGKISDCATPKLYKNLVLNCDVNRPRRLRGILKVLSSKTGGSALKFTRSVRIGKQPIAEGQECPQLDGLLRKFKEHSLKFFSQGTGCVLSPAQTLYLIRHQRRLRNLSVFDSETYRELWSQWPNPVLSLSLFDII